MKLSCAFGILLLTLGRLTPLVAAVDDQQRLIPWNILGGKPDPDEALVATADWTSLSRETLSPRISQSLNKDWTFNYFPEEQLDTSLLGVATDDSKWPVVSLPHTWSTYETTREIHPFIARPSERFSKYWWYGWGVYRKQLTLDPKAIAGRRVFIEFDGASKYTRVWLNGKEIGDHNGGYASFYFDLTAQLRPGSNVLAVAVCNRRDDALRTPPMTAGNFDVYGGITRDVRLVVKNPVYIPFQGSYKHEGGTFITTPEVSADRATAHVRTWVKNDDTQPRTVLLRTILRDPSGKPIAQQETRADLPAGTLQEIVQPNFAVTRPQLWSPETPVLYRVDSEVCVGDTVMDRYASPLGFRWFEWNKAENRGYLNGKKLHIHGTNRHEEFPWLGSAVPKWITIRDMADIRFGQGHNFIRTTHYTQDSLVYDLCDRYGLLVCEEVPNIKDIDFNEDVQRQQVIEMIRRDRNHPGIVMWSMGNETSDPANSDWAKAEDATRIIHLRHSSLKPEEAGHSYTSTDKNIDMENLLRCTIRGWTDRDVADFEPANNQYAGTEEWQHHQAMIEGGSQRGRIDMPNGVMWIYADHGADRQKYLNSPLMNINAKGWVDLYRIPKFIYWLWAAHYTTQPMVFVHPQYWQSRYIGQKHDFIVDSNCDSVELFVNGRSLGTQRPSAIKFWNVTFSGVPVEKGELRVVGRKGSQTVSRRVAMAGAPARLSLTTTHDAFEASRDSVAMVTMDVADAAGALVPEFNRELKWEITGPGVLVTPGTYTSDLKQNLAQNGSFYIVAPVCALVRSTGEPGEIVVTVKAEGVAPASVKISAKPVMPPASFVTQVALKNDNRMPVATAPQSDFAPARGSSGRGPAMKIATTDITLPAGKDLSFYKAEMAKWFAQNDPAPMKRLAFEEAANAFAQHLAGNQGLLVADDFGHTAQQFNDVCAIESVVRSRKLPGNFAKELILSYARRIIRNGEPLRVADEEKWIKSIPAGTKVEAAPRAMSALEAFNQFYPAAGTLSLTQRDAAFVAFQRLNAAVGNPFFDAKTKQTILYPANAPLLQPTLEDLVKISAPK